MLRRPHPHHVEEEPDITIGGIVEEEKAPHVFSAASTITTSAHDFVEAAAADVLPKQAVLGRIHQRMEDECISSIEQLQFLESAEFKALGFPLGLTTVIRQRLSHMNHPASLQENKSTNHAPLQYPPKSRETESDDDQETGASIFAGSVDSDISAVLGGIPGKKTSIFWQQVQFLYKTTHWKDWCIPVDHQMAFKKATMFAMEQNEFKEYTLRHSEIWMVISSLFLGATMTCWSLLPDTFGNEDLRDDTTLGYLNTAANSFMVFTTQMNVGAISAHAVTFTVAGTVHEENFKSFFATAGIYMVMCGEMFFLISLYFFFVSLFLLTYLRIEIIYRRHDLATSSLWPVGANVVTTCICLFYMFCYINFVSRTAMHTGLMLDPTTTQCKGEKEFASERKHQEQHPEQPQQQEEDQEIYRIEQPDHSSSHNEVEYDLVKQTLRKSIVAEKDLFNELVRCSTK